MDLSRLKQQLIPKIEELGYELFDIELVKEQKNLILRIYIDNEEDITVDDCQIVSHGISDLLDEIDPISTEYFLEVSSPGAEREIRSEKDYQRFKGYYVRVEKFEQTFEGTLFEVYTDSIILQIKGKNTTVSKIDIQKIRLAIKF